REVRASHSGIMLTAAQQLLDRAIAAMEERKFSEAENLAGQANDVATAAGRNYEAAQAAINRAEADIATAGDQGRDIVAAEEILEQARNQFENGDYLEAVASAEKAAAAIRDMPEPQTPVGAIVAGAVAAGGGGAGAFLFFKMRKRPALEPPRREPPRAANNDSSTTIIRPPSPPTPIDRKSTRLNSSHVKISYAVFCLKKKKNKRQ